MPSPTKKAVADIKSQLLNPALTSHFQCWFQPPSPVIQWIRDQSRLGYGLPYNGNEEFISIACMDASLPGSSLMTHEQNNDFHGVTERHAYRRDYGSGTDFTFIVDNNHHLIFFFENWIRYIVNEQIGGSADYPSVQDYTRAYSRVNYPDNYMTPYGLYINKFERDYNQSLGITYQFIKAYPISITSMPISYEGSQLLKCTVTFTYLRYVAQPTLSPNITPAQNTSLPPGVTNTTGPRRQDLDIWALQNQSMIRSVGTADQRAILRDVQNFYGNNSAAQQNLQRLANQGGYTAGTGGRDSGQALPGVNLQFGTLGQPVGNALPNPLLNR
jgi:hypothetical protein